MVGGFTIGKNLSVVRIKQRFSTFFRISCGVCVVSIEIALIWLFGLFSILAEIRVRITDKLSLYVFLRCNRVSCMGIRCTRLIRSSSSRSSDGKCC